MVVSVTIPCAGTLTIPIYSPPWSNTVGWAGTGFWKQSLLPIITQGSGGYGGNNASGSAVPTTYGLGAYLLEYIAGSSNARSLTWGTVGISQTNMYRPLIIDGSSGLMLLGNYNGHPYNISSGTITPRKMSQVTFRITQGNVSNQIKQIRCVSSFFTNTGGVSLLVNTGSTFDSMSSVRPICVGSVGAGNQVPVKQFIMNSFISQSGSVIVAQPGGYLVNTLTGAANIIFLPPVDGDVGQYTQPTTFMTCPDTRATSPFGPAYTQGAFYVCANDTHCSRPYIGSVSGNIVAAGNTAKSNYPYFVPWPSAIAGVVDQAYQFPWGAYVAPHFDDAALDTLWASATSSNCVLNPSYRGLCCRFWPNYGSPRDILLWCKTGPAGAEAYYYNITWNPMDSSSSTLLSSNNQSLDWKIDDKGIAYVYGNALNPVSTSVSTNYQRALSRAPNLVTTRLSCWRTMCLPISRGTR